MHPPEAVCKLETMHEPSPVLMKTRSFKPARIAAAFSLLLPVCLSAQISLSTAVELAEKNSAAVRAGVANVQKANAALAEAHNAYIPNFVLGSSPGYAYGFPFGYPSVFSATSQSLLISFSQRDYVRAARAALESADLSLKDTQHQVALDASLDYIELDYDLKEIAALDEENTWAGALAETERQRVAAGVDARTAELDAELTAAQVDEKRIHLENDADAMRQKLGHLTGLPAIGLTTVSASIPPTPAASAMQNPDDQALKNTPGVAAAYAGAKSKLYSAFGDARLNHRPLITFGAQYSFFEKFADYTKYFPNGFQYNNVAIGVVVTVPLFDASRRAKSRESAADAANALANADASLDVLSEQTSSMRGALRELGAQQRVAQVQSELAQEQLKSVETELTSGTGNPGAAPVPPSEAQKAHIEERQRYEEVLDANFALMKVELNLLRVTGQIEAWIRSSLQ